MDIKKLQTLVFDALEDVKGQDIQIFDTTEITSLFDRVCVVSGTSNRQTKALAASVRDKVKENGGDIVGMEGEATGEWVLVDLGDMVVHIMQPAIRAYYRLEEIWGGKEVKMGAAKRAPRASKMTAGPLDEEKPKRSRSKAAPVEVTPDMMAIQTTVEDEKPKRKPRVSKVAAELAGEKPARKPRAATATPKIPSGGRVKVAATKTATASSKEAAAKKATTRRKTAE
ncbi:ribosome silencing factor [Undibacterium baiyunense]|uniref:Ribosomal silencing factor RsfS n=1 Tax=Undibacterium baiyunense TaxID=2828731 RepID=A0A941I2W0_9BURK|nr:ribosome silencing factor [Undibacterium baiyunense]MBR7746330.1 ribosome silencing factor [Undibacterium baiyunense]